MNYALFISLILCSLCFQSTFPQVPQAGGCDSTLCPLASPSARHDFETPPVGDGGLGGLNFGGLNFGELCFDDTDIDNWDDISDELTTLSLNKRNINDVTIDELLDIPLITEQQALPIIRYRSLYGDLHSMSELSLVTGLDRPYQQLLKQLFYASPSTRPLTPADSVFLQKDTPFATYANTRKHSPFDYGHHNILLTGTIPTYLRQGYKDGTYRGYQYNHSLRYNFQTRRLQIALTAAQDAGEPFFSGTNKKGYDFYTGFVRLKNTAFIKDLVVGHYQISSGMGLIINNSYRLSRTALLLTSPETRLTLRGHTSRSDNNYLQGIATTIDISKTLGLDATFFASYRPQDATTSPAIDNPDDYTITTILQTGYHRTDTEISHRNATHQTVFGAGLNLTLPHPRPTPASWPFQRRGDAKPYSGSLLRLSLTALHIHEANAFLPDTTKLYKRYSAYGKDFTGTALAYTLLLPDQHLFVAGETALASSNTQGTPSSMTPHIATANTLRYKLGKTLTLFALQRFYSYQFVSLLANSFGDVSNAQNESGIYLGMSGLDIGYTTLSAYVDYAYHTWPRYGYTTSSHTYDAYLQAVYQHRDISITTRYRCRYQSNTQHTLRTLLRYTPHNSRWEFRTQLQGNTIPSSIYWGYLISQAVSYTFKTPFKRQGTQRKLPLSASLTYFDTNDYASRLYITDRTVTYGSMTSMLFGRGMRLNIMAQMPLSGILTVSAHITSTQYFDRTQISSSHQLIDSSNQTDIQLQLGIRI